MIRRHPGGRCALATGHAAAGGPGDHQAAGIGQIVGVAHMENLPFAIEIADRGNEFRTWRAALIRRGIFSLSVEHVAKPPKVCLNHLNERQTIEKYRESNKTIRYEWSCPAFPRAFLTNSNGIP